MRNLPKAANHAWGSLRPSVTSKPVIALDASVDDAILDAQALEASAGARKVITLVRMQFLRPLLRPSTRPACLAVPAGSALTNGSKTTESWRMVPVT